MPAPKITPNDPELFDRLVDGMTSLTGDSEMFFNINNVKYAYPDSPDNVRIMGDSIFTLPDARGRNADGRAMSGNSLEPGAARLIFSYLFGETARRQYSRIGELAIVSSVEAPSINSIQVDLYWIEENGTVWTRTEEQFGSTAPAEERVRGRRQLTDFELDAVEKIVRGTIPNW